MKKVALFPFNATGHITPMATLASALSKRSDVDKVMVFGDASMAKHFHRAGAGFVEIERPAYHSLLGEGRVVYDDPLDIFSGPLGEMATSVAEAMRFRPDVLVHDITAVHGMVVAHCLGIPAVSLITTLGLGAMDDGFLEAWAEPNDLFDAVNAAYVREFGIDIFANGGLPVLFPSRTMSIVPTSLELSLQVDVTSSPHLHAFLRPTIESTKYPGPFLGRADLEQLSWSQDDLLANTDPLGKELSFPLREIRDAKRDGRKVVYFSLGTVLTDVRFDTPVGGAPTGREFLLRMLDCLIAAFRDDSSFIVVVSLGRRFDEKLAWPSNFFVRRSVPQTLVLRDLADIFVTHHGANSMIESLAAGVPMISLPGATDQFPNAQMANDIGVARAKWNLLDPYRTCSASLLREVVEEVLADSSVSDRCREFAGKFESANGADEAARLIVALAGDIHRAQA